MSSVVSAGGGAVEVFYGHRVSRLVAAALGPDAANTVTPEALDAWLERRSAISALSFADLLDESRVGNSEGFMLTLDDGYRDNLTEALRVIESRDVPVLVFITTGFVARETVPLEATLARVIREIDSLTLPGGRAVDCASEADKRDLYESVRLRLKAEGVAGRDRAVDEILRLNPVSTVDPDDTFLTWDEVVRLDRHPLVTLGAHTHTHPLLTSASIREAVREISESKSLLEERIGHPVEAFAYPYGGHGPVVRRLVSRAGFRIGFTTEPRALPAGGIRRPMCVPRRDLHDAVEREAA